MSLPPSEGVDRTTLSPPTSPLASGKDECDLAETIDHEETTYPEGGLRAWLVVLGSFCGMYVTSPYNEAVQKITARKVGLLRLHEQHQHLQHLPVYTPTVAV
jgi:hypothetical protein